MINTLSFTDSKIFDLSDSINYSNGSVVSKEIITGNTGSITLFSFDKAQKLSEHTAPFDAFIQVIDGIALIIIDGKEYIVENGKTIILPANIPHAVIAKERFKMLLTMIKS